MSSPCHSTWNLRGLAAAALILGGTACERESRRFETGPTAAAPDSAVRQVELQPGPATDTSQVSGPYDGNAYAVSEGKRLYHQMNCSGCHFQGGGGIGPPLMDAEWIYGSAGRNIFETIVEGRPNGMPSFRGKLGDDQVWQLVAYVRSMSGLLAKDVASGRDDDMQVRSQEHSTPKASPPPSVPPRPVEPSRRP
jgi:cytochrome c oxidase cbb3-type subunit III